MAPLNSAFVKSFFAAKAQTLAHRHPFLVFVPLFLSLNRNTSRLLLWLLPLPLSAFVWDRTAHHEDSIFQIPA